MPRIPILLHSLGALPLMAAWISGPRRRRDAATAELEKVKQAEQAALRRIRLASQDLRTIGLNLQGVADHLALPAPNAPNDLAVVAAAIFDIADDLHEFTLQSGAAHVLNEEPLNLAHVLDGALTDVSNAIRPGRREWRVSPGVSPVSLKADRRALRYVLTRVLIVLVRSTGPEGAIDIELVPSADALTLVMTADASTPLAGIGGSLIAEQGDAVEARLALAHTLFQAHGGRIEMELRPNQPARARLIFPRGCLLEAPKHR
jgi:signal transduction histidine kinase